MKCLGKPLQGEQQPDRRFDTNTSKNQRTAVQIRLWFSFSCISNMRKAHRFLPTHASVYMYMPWVNLMLLT